MFVWTSQRKKYVPAARAGITWSDEAELTTWPTETGVPAAPDRGAGPGIVKQCP